jgi:hypothetical protein
MSLLRCMSLLVALSGLSETSACLSAFGAKRTYFGLWPKLLVAADEVIE